MNKLVIQLIKILGLRHSKRWVDSIKIFETTGSIEKHHSVLIIMSWKYSEQS